MDNAAHADASSSANASYTVTDIQTTAAGLIEIKLDGSESVFTRACYFNMPFSVDRLPCLLTDEQISVLRQAQDVFFAEKQACQYLARAEHSVFQLKIKLAKKGFSEKHSILALDYLESIGLVDDFRYAEAWLYTRSLSRYEGRQRLAMELYKRGISSKTAQKALNNFFSEKEEFALCQAAMERQIRKGYSGQKLIRSLQRKGFSFSMIRGCESALD